jgi:methylmalonyl-CoA mutase cobalamin-binding subunit
MKCAAIAVTDNHERGKTEAATALHDLGDTVDVHQLVDQVGILLVAITTATAAAVLGIPLLSFACHMPVP